MSLIEVLAELYSLPIHEVTKWPEQVQNVLHRNAIRRGWLIPSEGLRT